MLRSVSLAGVVRVEIGVVGEWCGQTWWLVGGERASRRGGL
jgi:hypothetical protein